MEWSPKVFCLSLFISCTSIYNSEFVTTELSISYIKVITKLIENIQGIFFQLGHLMFLIKYTYRHDIVLCRCFAMYFAPNNFN